MRLGWYVCDDEEILLLDFPAMVYENLEDF